MRTTWVGGLCAQPSTAAASGRLQLGPCAHSGFGNHSGVWASVLDHKCLFWSQLYFKSSSENIFYMAVFQAVVCKPASIHHKKVTSKPNRSHPFPHHSAPSYFHVHRRKQTNWRSNKNNEHSVLRTSLLGCFAVHENHQTRMDKMGLEFSSPVKKIKEKKRERKVLIS